MDRKTIAFCIICPVLLWGCGNGGQNSGTGTPDMPATANEAAGFALPAPAFAAEKPDSVSSAVVPGGNTPLDVVRVFSGGFAQEDDTLALCADPFFELDRERISMEVEFAMATGDSLLADSLVEFLSDSSVYIPVLSGLEGRVEMQAVAGQTIEPGDTIAMITSPPPDSFYLVRRAAGHIQWPGNEGTGETPEGLLMVSGQLNGDSVLLSGYYTLEPRYIHEEALRTFSVTLAGDTMDLTVVAAQGGSRLVYSSCSLDSVPLVPWH